MSSDIPVANYHWRALVESVPWLMLASAMRFYAYFSTGGAVWIAMGVSNLIVFLAFMLAARRSIEWSGGSVQFGFLPVREQLRLGQRILVPVALVMIGAATLAAAVGFRAQAPHFMMGFDGIAFDQKTWAGMAFSALLAALIYLLLIDAEEHGTPSFPRAAAALVRNGRWIVPAIALIALMQIALSFIQGHARFWIHSVSVPPSAPVPLLNLLYFAFVFGFAAVRLWLTVTILTLAVRQAYRAGTRPPALG